VVSRPTTETARTRHRTLTAGLLVALAGLVLVSLVSVAVGAKSIPLGTVWSALWSPDGSYDSEVVWDLRLPRTVLGLAVGAALGVAGALMQALTRNPLADPGLLGVNAGAAAAIVFAVSVLGWTEPSAYVWCAFAGAAGAAVVVYVLGSRGRSGATPVRLALAGIAVGAVLVGMTSMLIVLDTRALDQIRSWRVGSLAGRDAGLVTQVLPFVAAGLILALLLARPLNAIALGDELGRALGARTARTRALGAVAITLLCGAATSIAGPIWFLGLAVPHLARALTGPDQRWLLPYSMVLAPLLLVGSDVLGRVVARPGELEVGVVTALLGAPLFIALVRRWKPAQL
jgi:iron complex transport system permease protein